MGKRKRERDKLAQAWSDLNQANHAARQRASQPRLIEETNSDTHLLYHKVQSHTITGPGRITMQTNYTCSQTNDGIASGLQLEVPSQTRPEFNFDDNLDAAYTAYDDHIADTTSEPTKRKRTAGVRYILGSMVTVVLTPLVRIILFYFGFQNAKPFFSNFFGWMDVAITFLIKSARAGMDARDIQTTDVGIVLARLCIAKGVHWQDIRKVRYIDFRLVSLFKFVNLLLK